MKPNKKKLLVATVGLAAINYVGCSSSKEPTSEDASVDAAVADSSANEDAMISSGNLVVPQDDAAVQDATDEMISSGNLVPPPPDDASTDSGDAGN